MENQVNQQATEWVFVPVKKEHIIKRTETYVLLDVDGIANGIITSKFLRKKESEEYVYFSIPNTYSINCNVRKQINGKWTTTESYKLTAYQFRDVVLEYNKLF